MKKNLFKSMFLTRMVIAYSLVLIIITSIFTFALYRLLEEKMQNDFVQYQEELAKKSAGQLDGFLEEMDDIAHRVMSDTNIVIFFTQLNNDHDMNNYFRENMMNAIDMSSVLKTINGPSDPIWRINVYEQYGDFISSGTTTADYDVIASKLAKMDVEETMMDLKYSNRIVLPPQKDRWSDYFNSEYISILRPVKNEYAKNVYAVVEVQQDISKLKKLLESDVDNMQICIYDKNEKLILSQGEIPVEGKILKTSAVSDVTGWRVELTTINKSKYFGVIVDFFILIYLILVVFIIMITYSIASKITKPLQELRLAVNKVSPTNISIETNDGVIDEIKELGDTFSDVLVRIGNAADHEKKAYLLALQSQMNPHFLFNTLSVISAAGMEAGSDKVVDMCQQVSDTLRYIASYESSVVPFKDEIIHTRNYLKLMEARYEECFSYDIIVDDKINNIMVPKLILQPIVENCFKDAFADIEPPWEIHIDVGIDEGCWYMKVQDNGVGFSKNQIESIEEKIKRYSQNIKESYKELKIGGLGIVSTIIRLRLSFDAEVKYSIETNSEGTIITIKGKAQSKSQSTSLPDVR